jgi:hypothetical protein
MFAKRMYITMVTVALLVIVAYIGVNGSSSSAEWCEDEMRNTLRYTEEDIDATAVQECEATVDAWGRDRVHDYYVEVAPLYNALDES